MDLLEIKQGLMESVLAIMVEDLQMPIVLPYLITNPRTSPTEASDKVHVKSTANLIRKE